MIEFPAASATSLQVHPSIYIVTVQKQKYPGMSCECNM